MNECFIIYNNYDIPTIHQKPILGKNNLPKNQFTEKTNYRKRQFTKNDETCGVRQMKKL